MRYSFTTILIAFLALAGCADMPPGQRSDPDHFTLDTPIEQLAANSEAASVLRKDIPGLLEDGSYPMFKSMSLRLVGALSRGELSSQTLSQTEADLRTIPLKGATTALK